MGEMRTKTSYTREKTLEVIDCRLLFRKGRFTLKGVGCLTAVVESLIKSDDSFLLLIGRGPATL